jgi:hypothetical protein
MSLIRIPRRVLYQDPRSGQQIDTDIGDAVTMTCELPEHAELVMTFKLEDALEWARDLVREMEAKVRDQEKGS